MRIALLLVTCVFAASCASTPAAPPAPAQEAQQHGRISSLSAATSEDAEFCEHKVPEKSCTRCHPDLAQQFKDVGDWCKEHDRPESQCLICHPNLTFTPLPHPPEGADIAVLSKTGEDVEALAPHAPQGKVTLFDFYADWCAPCREVDAAVIRILHDRNDVAWRKLNVVSWETPIAKRYLKDVPSLPYVVVYGKDGREVAKVSGLDVAALEKAIAEGAAR